MHIHHVLDCERAKLRREQTGVVVAVVDEFERRGREQGIDALPGLVARVCTFEHEQVDEDRAAEAIRCHLQQRDAVFAERSLRCRSP